MSAEGIRAAKWVGRVQPVRAACLAAELRNAVTAASLAADQLDDEDMAEDVAGSVRHILALADALQPGGAELPTWPDPLRDRCACGCPTWRVTSSPTAPIIRCDSCGRLATRPSSAELPTVPEVEREVPCPCCEAGEPYEEGPSGRACSCCMNTGLVPESWAAEAKKARAELLETKRRKLAPPERDSSGGHEVDRAIGDAGDRHDWDACDALEASQSSHVEIANEAQDIGDDADEAHHRHMARLEDERRTAEGERILRRRGEDIQRANDSLGRWRRG